jgi:hypothetical protein
MNMGEGGLAFVGLIVGELLGGVFILFLQGSYIKKLAANGDVPVPEWRLPPAIVGGVTFAAGMFWYGLPAVLCIEDLLLTGAGSAGLAIPRLFTGWCLFPLAF